MSSQFFPPVDAWRLARTAFAASMSEMARDGINGNEGIALWLGRRAGAVANITHVICLRGRDVVREPNHLHISAGILSEVGDIAIEYGLSVIGQIHSHGPHVGVDLSLTDRRYGIAVPYFLSVVAPDYALQPDTSIEECGVHVFEIGFGYRRLDVRESASRLHLTDDIEATVLLAGSSGS